MGHPFHEHICITNCQKFTSHFETFCMSRANEVYVDILCISILHQCKHCRKMTTAYVSSSPFSKTSKLQLNWNARRDDSKVVLIHSSLSWGLEAILWGKSKSLRFTYSWILELNQCALHVSFQPNNNTPTRCSWNTTF